MAGLLSSPPSGGDDFILKVNYAGALLGYSMKVK